MVARRLRESRGRTAAVKSLGLDFGSTRIKAARVDDRNRILDLCARPAPAVVREGARAEFDALEFEACVTEVLEGIGARAGEHLGIASQRSSFLLFDARDATPRSPVYSWQDRAAAEWIDRHPRKAQLQREARARAGLPLSPHYMGPKLARLFAQDPTLRRDAHEGRLRVGTLESWWLARAGVEGQARTDPSMAARTLLFDLRSGQWSPEACADFDVPIECLPTVGASVIEPQSPGLALRNGLRLRASLADQSAGALFAVGASSDLAWVNFGTGTFVLAPCGFAAPEHAGYLASLLAGDPALGMGRFAAEGTIHSGVALDARDAGDIDLPSDAHALPDSSGVGAPHWRAEVLRTLSPSAAALNERGQRRALELGVYFRVREILEDFERAEGRTRRCVVSGGALLASGLAQRFCDAVGRDVEVLDEPEATLCGAARLARGAPDAFDPERTSRIVHRPSSTAADLSRRYEAWRRWLADALRPNPRL